jgi:hypothetical protein
MVSLREVATIQSIKKARKVWAQFRSFTLVLFCIV